MADTFFSLARLAEPLRRRSFLRYAGATAGTAAVALAGCKDDNDDTAAPTVVNVGTTDTGVLNLAYALEQLELAFYLAVRNGAYYKGLTSGAEKQVLDDLTLHEKIHRDFLSTALSTAAIKTLETDFSSIDFDVRLTAAGAAKPGVLNAAMAFEDLGVAAYNGAARFFTNPINLAAAGKIVSVEARHAALIRDLISYNSFVDGSVVDVFTPASSAPGDGSGSGMELSKTPAQVAAIANAYLKEGSKLSVANLV